MTTIALIINSIYWPFVFLKELTYNKRKRKTFCFSLTNVWLINNNQNVFLFYLSIKFDFYYIKLNFQCTNNAIMSSHLFIKIPRRSVSLSFLSISWIMYISCGNIKDIEGRMENFLYMFILMYMWFVYFLNDDNDKMRAKRSKW
jgi:hypothetical protein